MKLHKFSLAIEGELLAKARYVVSVTPGLTLASLARKAIANELFDMECWRGHEYRIKPTRLKAGRPRKMVD